MQNKVKLKYNDRISITSQKDRYIFLLSYHRILFIIILQQSNKKLL